MRYYYYYDDDDFVQLRNRLRRPSWQARAFGTNVACTQSRLLSVVDVRYFFISSLSPRIVERSNWIYSIQYNILGCFIIIIIIITIIIVYIYINIGVVIASVLAVSTNFNENFKNI